MCDAGLGRSGQGGATIKNERLALCIKLRTDSGVEGLKVSAAKLEH